MHEDAMKIIGHVEQAQFPELGIDDIHVRIDTGARTSAIWVSEALVESDGRLKVVFLGDSHPAYTGKEFYFNEYSHTVVASSNGQAEPRFKIKILVKLGGKKIRATFTLANRSNQVYPVLIGRNILRGKYVVNVKEGSPLHGLEKARTAELRQILNTKGK